MADSYVAAHSDHLVRVRFRLLAPAPFEVCFPSCTYRFAWSFDGFGRAALQGHRLKTALYVPIYSFSDFPSVELSDTRLRVPWTEGVCVPRPSVADTILTRMVREGRAELIEWPHCEVAFKRFYGRR